MLAYRSASVADRFETARTGFGEISNFEVGNAHGKVLAYHSSSVADWFETARTGFGEILNFEVGNAHRKVLAYREITPSGAVRNGEDGIR